MWVLPDVLIIIGRIFFYPEEVKEKDYLKYYAENFECVELNSTFYHLPSWESVLSRKGDTPNSFIFCPSLAVT